ncbi:phage major capsid protein [Candidatus Sororendozoicomonas aggregata]|uniref:phage major capsid protein n=1 Tax=Candidatus Sororendozoicomonas aggregata TaxID=3073239 RepID=UPI002ED6BDEE
MATDIQDIENVAKEIKQSFNDFKEKNDQRLEAVEQEKGKLAGQVDDLNSKLSELDALKTSLEEELKTIKRPGTTGNKNKDVEAHQEAFARFVRKGDDNGLKALEQKALNTGADEDGGYAVPEELDRSLLDLQRDAVVMRQEANVITVGTGDYKKLVNLHGAASGWVGEEDARPQTGTPKLAQIAPLMGEIYGNPQATQKMLDDSFFNVENWLSNELQIEFSEKEEAAFTSGDGNLKAKGFLAYSNTEEDDAARDFGILQAVRSGSASGITADALIKLVYALRKVHRMGAKFMMNNKTLFDVRILKDSEGNYLWRPGLDVGQPSSLLGYSIAENEQMPEVAADALPVAFGNFKRAYTIVDRIGTRVLRDPFTNKPFVGFYTTKRVGGMLTDSEAIKLLKVQTSA